jgi:hypothetical protein
VSIRGIAAEGVQELEGGDGAGYADIPAERPYVGIKGWAA